MKKILLLLAVFASLSFQALNAQDGATNDGDSVENVADTNATDSAKVDSSAADTTKKAETPPPPADGVSEDDGSGNVADEPKKLTGHALIRDYFIQGGWEFMSLVLICLIVGLGIALGRIIILMLNWINVGQFIKQIEVELQNGNVEKAKDIARDTRGPVASIYYQGLDRADEGLDIVERSIVSYGSVQMGLLEKGLVWISLFISLAPMLGFMGTVIGMIMAFDQIEAMGDIQPSAVAGGIKVALLTTVAGLIAAVILQIFYNLITSIVDGMVNRMEDASITLVDMMVKYGVVANENKD